MKYYKDNQNNVFAYELDGSQDHLIGNKVQMTAEEVEIHINPTKTEEQLQAEAIEQAKAYLQSTDFYMTVDKYATLDDAIKEELTRLRAEARLVINGGE